MAVIGAIVVLEITGTSTFTADLPQVPPWVWSALGYGAIAVLPATALGYLFYRYFREPKGVLLVDLHPVSRDHQVGRVGKEMWRQMTVLDPKGREVGTDQLLDVTVNGETGYEVINYDPEKNVATATWMGGASSSELRSYQSMVRYVHEQLGDRADMALDLRANLPAIVREVTAEMMNRQIRVSEEADLPEGDVISTVLSTTLEKYDVDVDPDWQVDAKPTRRDDPRGQEPVETFVPVDEQGRVVSRGTQNGSGGHR